METAFTALVVFDRYEVTLLVNTDGQWMLTRNDVVFDGVFDQQLQAQRRHTVGIDISVFQVLLHLEIVPKTDLVEVDVCL